MPYPGEQYGVLDCTQLHQVVIPGKVPGLTPVNIPSAGLKKMKGNCVYRSLCISFNSEHFQEIWLSIYL